MKSAQFSAILDGVTKKKDGTLSLKFGTQELNSEETATIFDFGNKQIWVALSETPLSPEDLDIPETMLEFRKDKSPSERLRASLYVFWEQNKETLRKDWDTFYKGKMDEFIQHIKSKLE